MKNHLDYSDSKDAALGGFSAREIFNSGVSFAEGIPACNMEMLNDGMDEEDAKEVAFAAWYEAQDNARQYSPWEFTAKAINDMEDSERAWSIYEEGIAAAFEHAWSVDVARRFTFAT